MAKVIIDRGCRIVSGGTQNHLMLVDMIGKGITGKDAEAALGKANITVSKNAVPNDPQKPFVTSGLRIGTPAVTTRAKAPPESAVAALRAPPTPSTANPSSAPRDTGTAALTAPGSASPPPRVPSWPARSGPPQPPAPPSPADGACRWPG